MTILTHSFNQINIAQLSEETTIGGKQIPAGYVNATQMCFSYGRTVERWLRQYRTQKFLESFCLHVNKSLEDVLIKVTINDEDVFFIHPEIEMAVICYLNPEFEVAANYVNFLIVSGQWADREAQPTFEKMLQYVAEDKKEIDKNGLVYLIGCKHTEVLKIGFTKDIKQRFVSLQSSYPFDLIVLQTRSGTLETEKELLERFKSFRLKGEWFKWTDKILCGFKK